MADLITDYDTLDRLVDEDTLALRDAAVALATELEKARAAITRVRALHEPMETDRYPVCFHCIGNEPWPCPTIRALEGDE